MNLDIKKIRADFPILQQMVYNKPFAYFDNAATTQKPNVVIDHILEFYSTENSNIHRGVHYLSERATTAYEDAREYVRTFINARHHHEIIFTHGTTESINLVASSFGERYIRAGDEIIISHLEHHSNIVPWQMLCERKQAILKIIPVNDAGELLLDEFEKLLTERTRIVAITQVSNAIGTIVPIDTIIRKAHQHNVPVLVDGAQGIQHLPIDVQQLDADFYVFSGHKVYAPTGIGVLYAKEHFLNEMPPYQGGGDMIKTVSFEKTVYNDLPFKFEAGTTNYLGAIGLAKALEYISQIGLNQIATYESQLLNYATQQLEAIEGLSIYGHAQNKCSVLSFLLDNIHPHDTGTILDKMGIAVRTGTHCAQPIMTRMGIDGTVRVSFSFYNTTEEIDRLSKALMRVKQLFDHS